MNIIELNFDELKLIYNFLDENSNLSFITSCKYLFTIFKLYHINNKKYTLSKELKPSIIPHIRNLVISNDYDLKLLQYKWNVEKLYIRNVKEFRKVNSFIKCNEGLKELKTDHVYGIIIPKTCSKVKVKYFNFKTNMKCEDGNSIETLIIPIANMFQFKNLKHIEIFCNIQENVLDIISPSVEYLELVSAQTEIYSENENVLPNLKTFIWTTCNQSFHCIPKNIEYLNLNHSTNHTNIDISYLSKLKTASLFIIRKVKSDSGIKITLPSNVKNLTLNISDFQIFGLGNLETVIIKPIFLYNWENLKLFLKNVNAKHIIIKSINLNLNTNFIGKFICKQEKLYDFYIKNNYIEWYKDYVSCYS